MVFTHRLPDGFFQYILGKHAGKGPRGVYRALRNVTGAGGQSEHRQGGGESDLGSGQWRLTIVSKQRLWAVVASREGRVP